MIDYAAITADALAAIKDAGKLVTFTRAVTKPNSVTGMVPDEVEDPTTFQGYAVRLRRYTGQVFENLDANFKTNLVKGKAAVLLLAHGEMTDMPEPGDTVTLSDASVWTLLGLSPLAPDNNPIVSYVGLVLK